MMIDVPRVVVVLIFDGRDHFQVRTPRLNSGLTRSTKNEIGCV
jgi:hypothetical protein